MRRKPIERQAVVDAISSLGFEDRSSLFASFDIQEARRLLNYEELYLVPLFQRDSEAFYQILRSDPDCSNKTSWNMTGERLQTFANEQPQFIQKLESLVSEGVKPATVFLGRLDALASNWERVNSLVEKNPDMSDFVYPTFSSFGDFKTHAPSLSSTLVHKSASKYILRRRGEEDLEKLMDLNILKFELFDTSALKKLADKGNNEAVKILESRK